MKMFTWKRFIVVLAGTRTPAIAIVDGLLAMVIRGARRGVS